MAGPGWSNPPLGGAAAVGFGCFKHERQVRRGVALGLPPPFTPRPTRAHRHVGVLAVGWVTRPDIHPRGPMSPDTQFAFTITPRMDYKHHPFLGRSIKKLRSCGPSDKKKRQQSSIGFRDPGPCFRGRFCWLFFVDEEEEREKKGGGKGGTREGAREANAHGSSVAFGRCRCCWCLSVLPLAVVVVLLPSPPSS